MSRLDDALSRWTSVKNRERPIEWNGERFFRRRFWSINRRSMIVDVSLEANPSHRNGCKTGRHPCNLCIMPGYSVDLCLCYVRAIVPERSFVHLFRTVPESFPSCLINFIIERRNCGWVYALCIGELYFFSCRVNSN